jgi:hypothetical protein
MSAILGMQHAEMAARRFRRPPGEQRLRQVTAAQLAGNCIAHFGLGIQE